MNWQAWTQIAAFAVVLTALVRPLGWYIARIADPKAVIWRPVATVERLAYRFARVDPAEEQGWIAYAVALYGSTSSASSRSMRCCGCNICSRSTRRNSER